MVGVFPRFSRERAGAMPELSSETKQGSTQQIGEGRANFIAAFPPAPSVGRIFFAEE